MGIIGKLKNTDIYNSAKSKVDDVKSAAIKKAAAVNYEKVMENLNDMEELAGFDHPGLTHLVELLANASEEYNASEEETKDFDFLMYLMVNVNMMSVLEELKPLADKIPGGTVIMWVVKYLAKRKLQQKIGWDEADEYLDAYWEAPEVEEITEEDLESLSAIEAIDALLAYEKRIAEAEEERLQAKAELTGKSESDTKVLEERSEISSRETQRGNEDIMEFPVPTEKEALFEFIKDLAPRAKVGLFSGSEHRYYKRSYEKKLDESIAYAQATFAGDPMLEALMVSLIPPKKEKKGFFRKLFGR